MAVRVGAEGFRELIGEADLHAGLVAYSEALVTTFYLCAAGSALAFFCSFGMGWRSVKEKERIN